MRADASLTTTPQRTRNTHRLIPGSPDDEVAEDIEMGHETLLPPEMLDPDAQLDEDNEPDDVSTKPKVGGSCSCFVPSLSQHHFPLLQPVHHLLLQGPRARTAGPAQHASVAALHGRQRYANTHTHTHTCAQTDFVSTQGDIKPRRVTGQSLFSLCFFCDGY